MNTIGILLHVYHLYSEDWERLVWGDTQQGELGVGATLFEYLLTEPANVQVHTILYNGPSSKAGVSEGEYTLRFLQDKQHHLVEFPRLKHIYDAISPRQRALFAERVAQIQLGESIADTYDEIHHAAAYFHERGVARVAHIAAATHAPRCIQLQSKVREDGFISPDQLWCTIASDRPFAGRTASDVAVVEPPHRADDPLLHYRPTFASLVRRYYGLTPAGKKQLMADVEASLERLYGDASAVSTQTNSATK
jgi:hypothetical protein